VALAALENRLFVCVADSISLYDISDFAQARLLGENALSGCSSMIYTGSVLLVTTTTGVVQFDVSGDSFEKLSELPFR
jgi:hypothetical protein